MSLGISLREVIRADSSKVKSENKPSLRRIEFKPCGPFDLACEVLRRDAVAP
jgi:hypothetical protein